MWPLVRSANRFHILYRWIIFCFNHLCDSRGHDPRSRWVATSPETLPCLVCRERRMSDEALMCCAVCLTACLLIFHTFSLVVCLLCHYSSAPSWWISWPFSANPAWLYVQWNESLLEIQVFFSFLFVFFFTRFCSVILKYTPKSSHWTSVSLLILVQTSALSNCVFCVIFFIIIFFE